LICYLFDLFKWLLKGNGRGENNKDKKNKKKNKQKGIVLAREGLLVAAYVNKRSHLVF